MTSTNLSPHVNVSFCSQCEGGTEYHCLTCEKNLCPDCKMKHLLNLDTKKHNIKRYKYRNRITCTSEPCEKHPNQVYEMYCEVCDVPFCIDCKEHKEHKIRDIMSVYKEWEKNINNVKSDTLYNLQVLLLIIKHDFKTCKNEKDILLSKMARKLQKVKHYLDTASVAVYFGSKENENTLLEKTATFANKPVQFLRFMKNTRFQEIKKPPFLVQDCPLSLREVDMQNMIKLLNVKINERGKRTVENKHLIKLISDPELQELCSLKDFASCGHISCMTRNQAWITEENNLVLIEITTGKYLHVLNDVVCKFWWGLHTVNADFELFYISNDKNIKKLSYDRETTTTLFKPHHLCEFRSLYCSPLTGDLLIGKNVLDMFRYKEYGQVERYDKSGKLTVTIPVDHTEHTPFKDPNYITENTNGDVVVSDYWCGIVVTDRGGKHLFTYIDTPFGSRLLPRGICTDALSQILVCDCYTETLQILDKGGNFLLHIPIKISQGPYGKPCSLSYDWNTHFLWVGSWDHTVSRYKHIKRPFDLSGK